MTDDLTKRLRELNCYDAGLLPNPADRATTEWWQNAVRVELARAHGFYADQWTDLLNELDTLRAKLAEAEAQGVKMREAATRLDDFTEHDSDCANTPELGCTCGLMDAHTTLAAGDEG